MSTLEPVQLSAANAPTGATRPPAARMIPLWSAIVALLAGSFYGMVTLGSGDGAASGEEAVRKLFTAIADEDVLGALGAIVPAERDAAVGGLQDMVSEAKRLDLLDDDASLSGIRGVDIEFADLDFTAEALAPGFETVRLEGGNVSSSVTPRRLPIGEFVEEMIGDDLPDETTSVTEPLRDEAEPLELVAREIEGRWYVSVGYTVAELARKDSGHGLPEFGRGVAPQGADTPEAAVDSLVRAALGLDVERLISLVSPGEAGALQDYAPLFLEDAKAAASDARATFTGEVTKLDLGVDRDGNRARVTVKQFAVDVTIDGERGAMAYDGDCVTVTPPPPEEEERFCAEDAQEALPIPAERVPKLTIAVVREGDKWYVSPTRTWLDLMVSYLEALDRESLDQLRDMFTGEETSESMSTSCSAIDNPDGSSEMRCSSDGEDFEGEDSEP